MFGLGWTEIFVIGVIAVLVIPTKDLPAAMRTAGRTMGGFRRMMRDFQRQVEDAVRDDELDQLRKQVAALGRETDAELRRGLTPGPSPSKPSSAAPAMTALPDATATEAPPAEAPPGEASAEPADAVAAKS